MLCGQGTSSRAVPIHEFRHVLHSTTVDVLPAAHALTGCDSTSKVSTKNALIKIIDSNSDLIIYLIW